MFIVVNDVNTLMLTYFLRTVYTTVQMSGVSKITQSNTIDSKDLFIVTKK